MNVYGRGSEQQVTNRCSGANIKNMAQRMIRFIFTGSAKLNKVLAPIPKRYTTLYTTNECVVFSSLHQVTAKPTLEKVVDELFLVMQAVVLVCSTNKCYLQCILVILTAAYSEP